MTGGSACRLIRSSFYTHQLSYVKWLTGNRCILIWLIPNTLLDFCFKLPKIEQIYYLNCSNEEGFEPLI